MTDAPTPSPPLSVLTPDDIDASFDGPAIYANRVFFGVTSAGIRLSFMEQHSKETVPAFRAAVLLSVQDTINLKNLLIRQLAPIEEALAKGEAITVKGPDGQTA